MLGFFRKNEAQWAQFRHNFSKKTRCILHLFFVQNTEFKMIAT